MTSTPTPLLIGTNNPDKAAEMRDILEHNGTFKLIMPSDVPDFPTDIPETGATLEENAYLKASAIFSTTIHACIADDTGLEVDALGGAPGIYAGRYAGENASYAENRLKLLDALQNIPLEQRTARFRTVICYQDGTQTFFAEGVCEGRIAMQELGNAGFGYDALFVPDGYDASFAQLSFDEKHRISHRGRALTAFLERCTASFAA
jgi:non-canonical purine NTP pyrophosphatase (RdgB/HAM1 family)